MQTVYMNAFNAGLFLQRASERSDRTLCLLVLVKDVLSQSGLAGSKCDLQLCNMII